LKEGKKKSVCERKRFCPSCDEFIEHCIKHECGKRYCETCKAHKEKKHQCYMQPLKNVLHSGGGVMFVFYDFQTTQHTPQSDMAGLNVPNLVCIQQFVLVSAPIMSMRTAQCGMRKHSFWEDPVGDILSYLCEDRPWCKQIIVVAHNANAFDQHFILKRANITKMAA
jgi:hypothetical protein